MRIDDFVYRLATSLPRHRKKVLFSLIGALVAAYFYNKTCKLAAAKEESSPVVIPAAGADKDKKKNCSGAGSRRVGVNAAFFNQLKRLLPICVPGKQLAGWKRIESN